MGIRTLIIVLLALACAYVIASVIRRRRTVRRDNKAPPDGDALVQCAICHTYVPRNNAVLRDGEYHCAGEHRGQ